MNPRYRHTPQLLLAGLLGASLAGCGVRTSTVEVVSAVPAAPVVAVAAQAPVAEAPKPEPPRDQVSREIADRLRPKVPALPAEASGPLPSPVRRRLENPEVLALPETVGLPKAQVPVPAGQARPRPPRPEMPLAREQTDQKPPQVVQLPEGTRLKIPGPDLERPISVPILSKAQPDREPLTDPTREASQEAALAGTVSSRTTPAAFERLNLPDPFEHRAAVRLRTPPPETVAIPPLPPRTPPKILPEKTPVRSAAR